MNTNPVKIEIMDTTLRDGEQTNGVSFMPHEKLMIAKALLQDLNVDRIEVASARVSDGEWKAVRSICQWARQTGRLDRVEVLGFVDGRTSLDWIHSSGCRHINLLCKGSENHCTNQLKKTLEQHVADIRQSLAYARELGIGVNVYLEDWSNGMKHSPDYVFAFMDALKDEPIDRFMLPDTLGILNPLDLLGYMRKMVKRYPGLRFDFHAHNDYDLAISNVLAAVLGGCRGIHTSVNGLGERAGNAPLASVQAILKDQMGVLTSIDESRLNEVSRMVESYSGISIPPNRPITGENVFTQVAGVLARTLRAQAGVCLGQEQRQGQHPAKPGGAGAGADARAGTPRDRPHHRVGRQEGDCHPGGFALHRVRRAQARHARGACPVAELRGHHGIRPEADGFGEAGGQRAGLRGERVRRRTV